VGGGLTQPAPISRPTVAPPVRTSVSPQVPIGGQRPRAIGGLPTLPNIPTPTTEQPTPRTKAAQAAVKGVMVADAGGISPKVAREQAVKQVPAVTQPKFQARYQFGTRPASPENEMIVRTGVGYSNLNELITAVQDVMINSQNVQLSFKAARMYQQFQRPGSPEWQQAQDIIDQLEDLQ